MVKPSGILSSGPARRPPGHHALAAFPPSPLAPLLSGEKPSRLQRWGFLRNFSDSFPTCLVHCCLQEVFHLGWRDKEGEAERSQELEMG